MSQVWLVTGATRGLGRAIAEAALAAGHSVAATTRSGSLGWGAEADDRLLPLTLDVSSQDPCAFATVVESTLERFDGLDVLVNNAGYGVLAYFEESDEAQVRAQFETNVFGLMRMIRAVLPVMRERRSGRILNVSSGNGYVGEPGASLYCASKFAVTGFTESLAAEVEPFGIAVTNLGVGAFRTDFLDPSSADGASRELADYEPYRTAFQSEVEQMNRRQVGDPAALGRLLLDVAAAEEPPVHLAVGADAIEAILEHQCRVDSEIAEWRNSSVATAHSAR